MRHGFLLLILTICLSFEMIALPTDSTNVEQLGMQTYSQDSTTFAPSKKAVRKQHRQQRKQCRKENPRDVSLVLLETVLPSVLALLLALTKLQK